MTICRTQSHATLATEIRRRCFVGPYSFPSEGVHMYLTSGPSKLGLNLGRQSCFHNSAHLNVASGVFNTPRTILGTGFGTGVNPDRYRTMFTTPLRTPTAIVT